MPREYGTVRVEDDNEVVKNDSFSLRARVALSVLVGVVAFCAVAALSFGATTSSVDPATMLDYNKIRAENAQIPGVAATCKRVTSGHVPEGKKEMRFAVFGFNSDTEVRKERWEHDPTKDFFVPLVEYPSTTNWAKDWEVFKSVLPENDVAVGVFKFPIWDKRELLPEGEQPADDVYGVINLVVTWKPEGVSGRELRRGGFFLPRVLIACEEEMGETFGATQHIALSSKSNNDNTYFDICATLADEDACAIEKEFFDCPFDAKLHDTPCNHAACSGADFVDAPGAIPQECCQYIHTQYCPFNPDAPGCSDIAEDLIKNVCSVYDDDKFEALDNIELMDFNECGPVLGAGGVMVRYYSNQMCKCVFENDKCFDNELCKRDRSCSVEGVKTYKGCDPERCRSPCSQFQVATDSSAYCSGCPPLKDGYKCFEGATGYKEYECCGLNVLCTGESVINDEEKCNMFDALGCGWGNNGFCSDLLAKQTRMEEVMDILTANAFDECQYGIDDWDGDGSAGTCEDYAVFKKQVRHTKYKDLEDGDECACCAACMGADDFCTTKCTPEEETA